MLAPSLSDLWTTLSSAPVCRHNLVSWIKVLTSTAANSSKTILLMLIGSGSYSPKHISMWSLLHQLSMILTSTSRSQISMDFFAFFFLQATTTYPKLWIHEVQVNRFYYKWEKIVIAVYVLHFYLSMPWGCPGPRMLWYAVVSGCHMECEGIILRIFTNDVLSCPEMWRLSCKSLEPVVPYAWSLDSCLRDPEFDPQVVSWMWSQSRWVGGRTLLAGVRVRVGKNISD